MRKDKIKDEKSWEHTPVTSDTGVGCDLKHYQDIKNECVTSLMKSL